MKGQTGYRRLLFAPTDKGFGKWCFEVRKSKAFIKYFASLSDESRLRHLGEYQERKGLLRQSNFVKSQLNDDEEAYLSLILSGEEKLDHRVAAGDRLFYVWKESEEFLIAEFRTASMVDIPSLIKGFRESLGMSKTEIAAIVGVSAKAYSNYELGTSKISAEVYLRIKHLAG